MILNVVKVLGPAAISFLVGLLITPSLTNFLYAHRLWKKRSGKTNVFGETTTVFNQLHGQKEIGTPRFGGVIIWVSTIIVTLSFYLASVWWPTPFFVKFNFFSRNQTWLPLFTLVFASLVGLLDDVYQVSDHPVRGGRGLQLRWRLLSILFLALVGAWWFYTKLGSAVFIPLLGSVDFGFWFIPFFILVMIAVFSSSVIDGLDGLSGGVMAVVFTAYSAAAFFQNQINLAAFCAVIAGSILAFLWFNIPPARFYMSETGIMGLTTTLTVVAFLTDSVFTLPIIALPLVLTSLSVIIQWVVKLGWRRKFFRVAPLHHHFEALGWPSYKVVMRYWVVSVALAIIGLILTLLFTRNEIPPSSF